MRGMLDVTDNLVERRGRAPRAHRGASTATTPTSWSRPTRARPRSPTRRTTISERYGFWLGDAFASGGSQGYDHKALGITARGAWESVKRHFRELGVDVMNEPFTVVGVGDMSGRRLRQRDAALALHQAASPRSTTGNIFVDPDPDPAASFAERQRLFATPGSSWNDYDRTAALRGRRRVRPRARRRS